MSSLRDRSNRLRPKSRGKYISFFGVLGLLVLPIVAPDAGATPGQPSAAMYLDKPFVQGSYVAEDYPFETTVTNFNDQTLGSTCSFNGATVERLYAGTPDCHVQNQINFGGASNESSTPTVGLEPNPSLYGQVGGGGVSIVFDSPQTYFGLWWSAGSAGNEIQLFSGSNLIANTNANDVASSLFYSSSLTAVNGDSYATSFYIANPYDWQEVGTPTNLANQDPLNTYSSNHILAQEPFVFIHFIAAPGVTFDRVNLVAPGNGFEFDNFTTSSASGIPANGALVLQRQIYEPNYVDFDANGGVGAMPRQYGVDGYQSVLQSFCLDWEDPNRCISAPNNSYATQTLGWNTQPDGSGTAYYFNNYQPYPFTESTTMYAQWQTDFQYSYLTYDGENFSEDVNVDTIWNYVDEYSYSTDSVRNFADITLPAPTRTGQHLEGWYTYDPTFYHIVRAGDPGEVVDASRYTLWDMHLFGHWVDNPPTAVDAATPEALLVYPRATSVRLPNLPLTGDVTASICIVESDSSGNQVSSDLQFTDISTATSGFTSSFNISSSTALVSNTSRYVRVTVSSSSDTACNSGTTHIVEIRPLGARFTQIVPLYLTVR